MTVLNKGIVYMNGGSIYNNGAVHDSGGGVYISNGTFIMYSGSIYNNSCLGWGVGDQLYVSTGGTAKYGDGTDIYLEGIDGSSGYYTDYPIVR